MIGLATEEGTITRAEGEPVENPTLNAYVAEETIRSIAASKNPLRAFQKSLDEKEITYKAVGIGKKIKFSLVYVVARVFSWFGANDDGKDEEETPEKMLVEEFFCTDNDTGAMLPPNVVCPLDHTG